MLKKSIVIASVILVATSLLEAQSINEGFLPGATRKFGVRYRHFNSQGTGNREVHVGVTGAENPSGTGLYDISGTLPNSSQDITWTASHTLTFTFDGSAAISSTVSGNGTINNTLAAAPGAANYLQIDIIAGGGGRTITLNNVALGTTNLGNFSATNTTKTWYVTGANLSSGFNLTAQFSSVGNLGGGDSSRVQFTVGYYVPPDSTGPITSNVSVEPNPAYLNGSATVSALVDDSTTGGSFIKSAEFSLNGGTWQPMSANTQPFNDAVSETVTADLTFLTKIGLNTVCVRGTDSQNNVGDRTCADFIVTYVFSGFFQPVDMLAVNDAKAGQAIPAKWRLTDAAGYSISDWASFVGIYSYPISCTSLEGNVTDAVEEYAPGNADLQYNGDGYWQYNWKTPKQYAGTCRSFYVELNSGEISPVANFRFKK